MPATVAVEQENYPPRVRIVTSATTVYRTINGVRVEVRGGVTDGVAYDYELPQNVEAFYDDGTGVAGPVVMPDVGCWLIPPGEPEKGARFTFTSDGLSDLSAARVISAMDIPGRQNAIVVDFGRLGRRGTMRFYVEDVASAQMWSCLQAGSPHFLSRPGTLWPLAGFADYIGVMGEKSSPVGFGGMPAWLFELDVMPSDRPAFVAASTVSIEALPGTIAALPGSIRSLGA